MCLLVYETIDKRTHWRRLRQWNHVPHVAATRPVPRSAVRVTGKSARIGLPRTKRHLGLTFSVPSEAASNSLSWEIRTASTLAISDTD